MPSKLMLSIASFFLLFIWQIPLYTQKIDQPDFTTSNAGKGKTLSPEKLPDHLSQNKRQFNAKSIEAYKNNPKYDYPREEAKDIKDNKKPKQKEANAVKDNELLEAIRIIIMVVFFILILTGVIYYVAKGKVSGIFNKKGADGPLISITSKEDLQKFDIGELLTQAEQQENYRLAIRFLYLALLQKLAEKDLIDWQKEKTNFNYYYELKGNKGPVKSFLHITHLFEKVWYGKKSISKAEYTKAKQLLNLRRYNKTSNITAKQSN